VLASLSAKAQLRLPFVLELVGQLQSGQDHVRLGRNLPAAFECVDARVDELCQRAHVAFIRIAAQYVLLTCDVDFDRVLHGGDPKRYRGRPQSQEEDSPRLRRS